MVRLTRVLANYRLTEMTSMRLAVPDLISNSYFPAISAVELGDFAEQGLDVRHELIFPVDKSYQALRDGEVDFIGGSAHAVLSAFPAWEGAKLLCALAQGMYWFLVMRAMRAIGSVISEPLEARRSVPRPGSTTASSGCCKKSESTSNATRSMSRP